MEFPWVRLALAQVILALILLGGGAAGASDSWASYERHWSSKAEPQQIAASWPISEVKREASS
jgi:hypothetical protein